MADQDIMRALGAIQMELQRINKTLNEISKSRGGSSAPGRVGRPAPAARGRAAAASDEDEEFRPSYGGSNTRPRAAAGGRSGTRTKARTGNKPGTKSAAGPKKGNGYPKKR